MPVLFRFHHCCLNSFLCLFLYFPPSASPVYFWHLVLNSLLKWVPPLLNAYFISHGAWMIQLGKKKKWKIWICILINSKRKWSCDDKSGSFIFTFLPTPICFLFGYRQLEGLIGKHAVLALLHVFLQPAQWSRRIQKKGLRASATSQYKKLHWYLFPGIKYSKKHSPWTKLRLLIRNFVNL